MTTTTIRLLELIGLGSLSKRRRRSCEPMCLHRARSDIESFGAPGEKTRGEEKTLLSICARVRTRFFVLFPFRSFSFPPLAPLRRKTEPALDAVSWRRERQSYFRVGATILPAYRRIGLITSQRGRLGDRRTACCGATHYANSREGFHLHNNALARYYAHVTL